MIVTIGQLREVIKNFPDGQEVEFILKDEEKNELKLGLKAVYQHFEFDNENSKVNNKIIFVTELVKEK